MALADRCDRARDRLLVADVRRERQAASDRGDLLERRLRAGVDDDVGARRREPLGDPAADSARGAGHPDDASTEVEAGGHGPDVTVRPLSAPAEEMQALVGHRFPGGTFTIEHWENVLLADATGSAPLPDGLVHPAWLFHGPIAAVGTQPARAVRALPRRVRRGDPRRRLRMDDPHAPSRGRPLPRLGRGDRGRAQAEPQPRGDGRDPLPDRDRRRRRRAGGLDRLDLARPEGRRVTVEPRHADPALAPRRRRAPGR